VRKHRGCGGTVGHREAPALPSSAGPVQEHVLYSVAQSHGWERHVPRCPAAGTSGLAGCAVAFPPWRTNHSAAQSASAVKTETTGATAWCVVCVALAVADASGSVRVVAVARTDDMQSVCHALAHQCLNAGCPATRRPAPAAGRARSDRCNKGERRGEQGATGAIGRAPERIQRPMTC
jgi:hypothetical protein